jgi:quinol monooxygenase YgiN
MVLIAGRIVIDPQHRDKAIAAAVEMMQETRREKGCISYVFSAGLNDPGCFRVFEEWESPEALAAHFESAHMARFRAVVPTLGVREMAIQRYEVTSVTPM